MAVLGCWKIASLIDFFFTKMTKNGHFGGKITKKWEGGMKFVFHPFLVPNKKWNYSKMQKRQKYPKLATLL